MTGWVAVALTCAASAGAALPSGQADLRRLRPRRARRAGPLAAPGRAGGRWPQAVVCALLAAALVAGSVAGVLACAVLGIAVVRSGRAATQRRRVGQERATAVSACTALAAELRAGRPPDEALAAAAQVAATVGPSLPGGVVDTLGRAAATERAGGLPGGVLTSAVGPGREVLGRLAVCWQVGTTSGAGLAEAVDGLATGLRRRAAVEREVAQQLAAPRSTARLVAGLPVLGVVMGAGLGADPLHVLLHTSWGGGCLVLAVLLDVAGVAWTDRLVARAEGS